MKKLFLLRHGKASSAVNDFERPLSQEGGNDIVNVAKNVMELEKQPEKIVASSALRAVQTAKKIKENINGVEYQEEKRIYNADADKVMEIIHEQPNEIEVLMLVGHNPTFEWLANRLKTDQENIRMSPGTLVEIDFDLESWEEIDFRKGDIINIINH